MFLRLCVILLLSIVLLGCTAPAANAPEVATATETVAEQETAAEREIPLYFIDEYSESRDPAEDLSQAIAEAQRSERRILLEIGGEWCVWCHILDDFLKEQDSIATRLKENFVVVKINVSPENENAEFMAQYPDVEGYPHFFVLEGNGDLLHSQNTALLEEGESYNPEVFSAFIEKWAP